MSKRANNKLKATGPAINPIGPKNPSPPKIESKIRNGWICIPFFHQNRRQQIIRKANKGYSPDGKTDSAGVGACNKKI